MRFASFLFENLANNFVVVRSSYICVIRTLSFSDTKHGRESLLLCQRISHGATTRRVPSWQFWSGFFSLRISETKSQFARSHGKKATREASRKLKGCPSVEISAGKSNSTFYLSATRRRRNRWKGRKSNGLKNYQVLLSGRSHFNCESALNAMYSIKSI